MSSQTGKGIPTYPVVEERPKGTGPTSAGQSGDTQGLSDIAETNSESVTELVEEGQFLEAELVRGMEESSAGEPKELRTRQLPPDSVPLDSEID